MFCRRDCEDKRKYAYEKAIEAYWKHVDRYHTWMNYYALFNGALLVAYCTILCATNFILTGKGEYKVDNKILIEGSAIWLKNDYEILLSIICLLGVVTSILWLLSIKGHRIWTLSWIRLIDKYEKEYNFEISVYRVIALDKKCNPKDEKNKSIKENFEKRFVPEGYSTNKLTMSFVYTVICAWLLVTLYTWHLSFLYLVGCIVIFCILVYVIEKFKLMQRAIIITQIIYSDVSNKDRLYI